MSLQGKKSLLRLAASAACLCSIAATASAQAGQPAAAPQLKPYTAPDQTASAGVPPGWTVTSGSDTVIQMTVPQGETVYLGKTFIAHDGAFQPGQHGPGPADLSMPNSASLADKLTMIFQQNAAVSGKTPPQITLNSATPIQLPASFGQCGRLIATLSGAQGPMKVMTALCSLPPDANGYYKNITLLAQAPAGVAAQSAPIAQAIFSSYRVPPAMLQKKLGPVTLPPPPMPSGGGAMPRMPTIAPLEDDTNTKCYDLVVIRETPKYQLPVSCGGTKPD